MTLITPNVIRVVINPNLKFASGSIVSAVNTGDGEGSILKSSSGGILTFKTLQAGTHINIVNNENEILINSSGNVPDTRTINGYALTSNITLTKDDLSLDQVDNTADIDKPLSSASIIALDTKVDKNVNIPPGTFTKITFDEKGLVTNGTGSTTADIEEVVDKRYVTDSHLVILGDTSGVNTGDETQTTIKQKLGSASISQDGYLNQTDFNIFNNKQDSLGYTPENISNKSTDTNLGTSNILYPTQNAVKTYVDTNISASSSIITASNLGTGEVIFASKSVNDLQFKTLIAGSNVSLSSNSNEITISASGGVSEALWGQITGSLSNQTDLYNELITLSGSIVNRELLTNKSTDTNLGTSDILYPTQNAVKTYVDNNIPASSSVTTASNIGLGEGEVYSGSSGSVLQFKTIKAGTNITVSNDTNEITINSTASGSSSSGSVTTASNLGSGEGIFGQKVGDDLQFKSLIAGTNITLSSSSVGITINSTASGSSGTILIKSIMYSSSSIAFQASDLGISMFEDCQVIKGHDNKYYMFLDDFSDNYNRDIYCVRSDSPDFSNSTYIGRVITRPNTRVGGVYYDNSNQEYVMFVNNFYAIGASPPSIHTYSISQADFPSGTWVDNGSILTGGGPTSYDYEYMTSMSSIINTGMSSLLYISSSHHRSTSLYHGGIAKINNKLSVSKLTNNPILTEKPSTVTKYNNSHFRTFIKIEGGYIGVYEALNTSTNWIVGAVFLDNSFTPVYELNESPFFEVNNQSFFNPNSNIIENNILYLYYQSTPLGQPANFCIQNVAKFNLNY